ncbi:hypothetical protein BDV11DRAFT_175361 [Aspergillus similis]
MPSPLERHLKVAMFFIGAITLFVPLTRLRLYKHCLLATHLFLDPVQSYQGGKCFNVNALFLATGIIIILAITPPRHCQVTNDSEEACGLRYHGCWNLVGASQKRLVPMPPAPTGDGANKRAMDSDCGASII